MNRTVEVEISALADLAVDCWRLQRWAFVDGYERDRIVPRQVFRALSSFLSRAGLEICDLTGQAYDPGLAVEVIDSEVDSTAPKASARIEEMIAPIVLWNGSLIKTGQVAIRRGAPDQEVAS